MVDAYSHATRINIQKVYTLFLIFYNFKKPEVTDNNVYRCLPVYAHVFLECMSISTPFISSGWA